MPLVLAKVSGCLRYRQVHHPGDEILRGQVAARGDRPRLCNAVPCMRRCRHLKRWGRSRMTGGEIAGVVDTLKEGMYIS